MNGRVELIWEGKPEKGQVLGYCGEGQDLCWMDMPKAGLPALPKNLAKDARVSLSVCDGTPCWKVRPPREQQAILTSGGLSLATVIATVVIVKRMLKTWNES